MYVVLFVIGTLALCSSALNFPSIVDIDLSETFRVASKVDILLKLESPRREISAFHLNEVVDRPSRLEAVKAQLTAHSNFTQESILEFLKHQNGIIFKQFWISNLIFVEAATSQLVLELAKFEAVEGIYRNEAIELPKVPILPHTLTTVEAEWGVKVIGAPAVWELGYTGEGVVVGTIDTGVFGEHEALKGSFRGDYGWFDQSRDRKLKPTDDNGHGTHVMGSLVGTKGIGVAPGAIWMACRAAVGGQVFLPALLACLEWMVCPTLPDGSNSDCSKAPHILSNSWTMGKIGEIIFVEAIDALHAAGIIPVWSTGNEGEKNKCKTVKSPADLDVISVGSVDKFDHLSSFSSVGPGGFPRLRQTSPHIVAPGELIWSALTIRDNAYGFMDGTSMATPHVSGAIALLLQKKPTLTYEQIRTILSNSANQNVTTDYTILCGGLSDDWIPNNFFGYGRLDVFKSFQLLTSI